ncbi:hypothetical protein NHQ30_000068 [Ciborinia camelliae]|nr:hypothetical protein NHQ30_000068 [Ciborinia camelliae]
MSSDHSTSFDPKTIHVTSTITSNTTIGNQDPTGSQSSPKRPLRPNAPLPILNIPSVISPTTGDRSFTPRSRQLCVSETPGLRTPPQGFTPRGLPSKYLQTPPLFTIPILEHAEQGDYFRGEHTRASSRSHSVFGQTNVASQGASPFLTTEDDSSHGSNIILDPQTCTSDSQSFGQSKPPYKTRKPSSDSLTMVNKRERINTEGTKYKQKHRCQGTCTRGKERLAKKLFMDEPYGNSHRNSLCGGVLPSQVTPTAPERIKVPNTRKGSGFRTRQGRGILTSGPAAPVISRRWSSVEIGTRQLKLPPLLKSERGNYIHATIPKFRNDIFESNPLDRRNRSSSFTAGSGYNDLVRSIRDRLTTCNLPSNQLLMPSAITLRKPSVSKRSDITGSMANSGILTAQGTGSATPFISSRQRTFSETQAHDFEAYVITREDVEAVMELLGSNVLNTTLHSPSQSGVEDQSPRGTRRRSLSFTPKGLMPLAAPATCEVQIYTARSESSPEASQNGITPITNNSPVMSRSPSFTKNPDNPGQFLQVSQTNFGRLGRLSEAASERSEHEVIWKDHDSAANSHLMEGDDVHSEDGYSECSSQGNFPTVAPSPAATINSGHADAKPCLQLLKNSNQDHRPSKEKGAFDPTNARMSISKWSKQCESEANEHDINTVTTTAKDQPKGHVISFPPLPRKSTNAWRSPLPDMTVSLDDSELLGRMLSQANQIHPSGSLYGMGIDARTGLSSPMLSRITTTAITPSSWLSEKAISTTKRVSSWLSSDQLKTPKPQESDIDHHRKQSGIKAHPKASARSGNASAIGSSIGSCTGARRRASSQMLAKSGRVTSFDTPLVHSHHGQGRKSWLKSIQDTARPVLTTEGEVEEERFWSTFVTRNASKDPTRLNSSPPASPCNLRDGKANNIIQPTISPSISETISSPRSPARESLSMVWDKYHTFPKLDWISYISKSRRNSLPPRLTAYESLLKIHKKYPPTPKPDQRGVYASVTGI